ncbi:HD-GYP domain-containing protein [Oscillospiraceae bacterium MB08-C2-2]|nr:HD-GYP domain-containing protein [Oscillospiraceae bacterium MB08-C2-2]
MRYISAKNLKVGMIVASPLYGKNFHYLISENTSLTEERITRIQSMGYPGVYIQDSISREVEVQELIPQERRMAMVQSAKQILLQAEGGHFLNVKNRLTDAQQATLVSPVIDAVIKHRDGISDWIDLKPHEDYPYYHAVNTTLLSALIGIDLGLSGPQLFELCLAALLHDVGNMFIPKNILSKPDRLTAAEYAIVKEHAEKGFQFLQDQMGLPIASCMGALHHHECYDGSGYPYGLSKERISIYGKIIAVTDNYDAMVSQRPHRAPLFPSQALAVIDEGSGKLYDPGVVESLHRKIALYPAGTCLQLSTGMQGIVYSNNPEHPDKPKVKLLNSSPAAPVFLDFAKDPVQNIKITRIIPL